MAKFLSQGVRHPETYRFIEPPIVECLCGKPLELHDASENDCKECRAICNGFGQFLAPRSQWGEETGESLFEIYNGEAGEDF